MAKTHPDCVDADAFTGQWMALLINGKPTMGEGTTDIDGATVIHTQEGSLRGVVEGPAVIEGYCWVKWENGKWGLHRIKELQTLDRH
ncbi:hypothetical protein [Mycolicibacter kumamotonensis]|uniref:Uncharacterized protein n=1 Tax=Mycolicibacter kumamotonensis TaxID=354243 RepID=A0A1B8SL93_9MYCO|nr:hypothetical protein [Mycolicibacter kumamotonensis]OBY33501.1 hypothetical protein ACT18_00725 [Mycolicibacter kumamotonensis]